MGNPPIDEKILSLIVKNLLISIELNLSNLTCSFLYLLTCRFVLIIRHNLHKFYSNRTLEAGQDILAMLVCHTVARIKLKSACCLSLSE